MSKKRSVRIAEMKKGDEVRFVHVGARGKYEQITAARHLKRDKLYKIRATVKVGPSEKEGEIFFILEGIDKTFHPTFFEKVSPKNTLLGEKQKQIAPNTNKPYGKTEVNYIAFQYIRGSEKRGVDHALGRSPGSSFSVFYRICNDRSAYGEDDVGHESTDHNIKPLSPHPFYSMNGRSKYYVYKQYAAFGKSYSLISKRTGIPVEKLQKYIDSGRHVTKLS